MSEETESKQRPQLYKPGVSGNPGGRPKLDEKQKTERQQVRQALLNLCPKAIEIVSGCLESSKIKDRQWAAEMIFERTLPAIKQMEFGENGIDDPEILIQVRRIAQQRGLDNDPTVVP
jgi:hypothetical protein